MGKISCKYEYLTDKAKAILDNRIGYRDKTLFPRINELDMNMRDPLDVMTTEILYCGKYEACDFIINHYVDILSRGDYRLLTNLVYQIKTTGFPIIDPLKKEQLRRVINKLTGDCNYCLWLCESPKDIYDFYIKDYIPRADKIEPGYAAKCPEFDIKASLSEEEYIERYVEETRLPGENVILCDMGVSGSLIAFRK